MKRAAGQLLRRGGPFGLPQGAPTASAALLRAPDAAETLAPEGSRGVSRQIVKQRMKSVGRVAASAGELRPCMRRSRRPPLPPRSNIAKITKAMKMVAASRLRGVQSRMEQSRGLSQPITRLLGDQPGAARARTPRPARRPAPLRSAGPTEPLSWLWLALTPPGPLPRPPAQAPPRPRRCAFR